ncbi:MAG: hypothetical protein ACWA40_09560 [Planktomarina sp.]
MLRILPILLALSWGQACLAQPIVDHDRIPSPWIEVIGDVNGDGQDDRLTSTPLNRYTDIIAIELGGAYGLSNTADIPNHVIAMPANWSDFESIELRSNTSFTLRTGCFACGRTHSRIDFHIAYRGGQFIVAGYSQSTADRIFATVEICDVNLLTGVANVQFEDIVQRYETTDRSFAMMDLKPDYTPQICQKLDQFDDIFKESYIKDRDAQ